MSTEAGESSQERVSRSVERRKDRFAERPSTRIWKETPRDDNPYVAAHAYCHGYELKALLSTRSFIDVLYLLFRGELPNHRQAQLLEALMIAFINPGPRHAATRSAMNAAIGKTDPALILPIALATFSGSYSSSGAVEGSMRFLRKHRHQPPQAAAKLLLEKGVRPPEGDWHIAPGFGNYYNSIDMLTCDIAAHLASLPGAGPTIHWGQSFHEAIAHHGLGWLSVGVVAAVLTDLGFSPRSAAGIYQIISAPGLLAHGVEFCNKPLTAMPFIRDEDYIIDDAS